MTSFDILALSIIGICIMISMMRGLVAEVVSLFRWIVAFMLGKVFAIKVADVAFSSVQPRSLAICLAFLMIFVALWLAQHLLRSFMTTLLSSLGLGGINRLFGACFGLIKGVFLVSVMVLICSFTDLPNTQSWQEAKTAGIFEHLALQIVPYLPHFVADRWSM